MSIESFISGKRGRDEDIPIHGTCVRYILLVDQAEDHHRRESSTRVVASANSMLSLASGISSEETDLLSLRNSSGLKQFPTTLTPIK